jgi:hypothetical protein
MWGGGLVQPYPELLEFVELCDINPKCALAARADIGVECPDKRRMDLYAACEDADYY